MIMKLNFRSGLTLLISLLAIAAILWVVLPGKHSNEDQSGSQRLSTGRAAPEFQAVNTDGEKVSLSEYRGKVVVLNFWASWCEPCVREMPLINTVFQDSNSEAVTLFVNAGESKGTINEFLSEHQFDFPVIIDATGRISGLYAVTGLPVTYLLDKNGNIAHSFIGEISSEQQLSQFIETLKED
ncbi:peroxiredoxin [Fontibacillus phaseoli]|uniref:Peroxiredoxin n=1 Tax=Fontibacillus phaseoli TaxID=1416533 RepID=A0A369BQ25_9BACL|nr:TlpA disulfide reductase family protein [Fontibacillus phaseoli]RCX23742.1 peroxiredoxin [Fontibacillus phaseoli]